MRFLHKYGAEAFSELLATKAVDALDHAYEVATRGIDVERDVHGVGRAIERLLGILAKAPRLSGETRGDARIQEQKIVQRLAAKFRVDEQELRRRMTALRRRPDQAATGRSLAQPVADAAADESGAEPQAAIDAWQQELLELLIAHPECIESLRSRIAAEQLAAEPCRRIYETCCRLADKGTVPAFDRLMLEFDEPAIKSLLVELDESGQAKGRPAADPEPLLNDLIKNLEQKEIERQRPAQIVAPREGELDDRRRTNCSSPSSARARPARHFQAHGRVRMPSAGKRIPLHPARDGWRKEYYGGPFR